MRVDRFDFDLPPDCIALRPADPRDAARLLVVDPDSVPPLSGHVVRDLPRLLRPGDALVVNDTRVLPARLQGRRRRGSLEAQIEATLHKREAANLWRAFARPAKRLRVGDVIEFGVPVRSAAEGSDRRESAIRVEAEVVETGTGGEVLLRFAMSGAALDRAIEQVGDMPLPPYIAQKRRPDSRDAADYQTLFAARAGAVAAPTASLHFTPALVAAIEARGVTLHRITLHVGAGTFLPVKVEDTDAHVMHTEWGEVSDATARALNEVHAAGGRIIAAGTTSLRILESAAQKNGVLAPFQGDTAIFITPGYTFRVVDLLLTNFHLPRSTLFMLASAFCGLDLIHQAYAHAIAGGYRFYSYGDACLLHRAQIGNER